MPSMWRHLPLSSRGYPGRIPAGGSVCPGGRGNQTARRWLLLRLTGRTPATAAPFCDSSLAPAMRDVDSGACPTGWTDGQVRFVNHGSSLEHATAAAPGNRGEAGVRARGGIRASRRTTSNRRQRSQPAARSGRRRSVLSAHRLGNGAEPLGGYHEGGPRPYLRIGETVRRLEENCGRRRRNPLARWDLAVNGARHIEVLLICVATVKSSITILNVTRRDSVTMPMPKRRPTDNRYATVTCR